MLGLADQQDLEPTRRIHRTTQVGERKVVTRSKKQHNGYFPSQKPASLIPYESVLERDQLFLAEVDPSVTEIRTQPFALDLELGDRIVRHYPDLLLAGADEQAVTEVKAAEKAEKPHYQALFEAARDKVNRYGYEYLVMTEREIRRQPRLNNCKFIFKHSFLSPSADMIAAVDNRLRSGPMPIRGVAGDDEYLRRTVLFLLLRGRVVVDLWQPLTENSEIEMAGDLRG